MVSEDGVELSSTKTNNVAFTAMEDTAVVPILGAGPNGAGYNNFMGGTMGFVAIWAVALTLAQLLALKAPVNTYFGTSL